MQNLIFTICPLIKIAKPRKQFYPIHSNNWKKWANGQKYQVLHQLFVGLMDDRGLCHPFSSAGCWWCAVREIICRLIVKKIHLNFRPPSLTSSILLKSTKKCHPCSIKAIPVVCKSQHIHTSDWLVLHFLHCIKFVLTYCSCAIKNLFSNKY